MRFASPALAAALASAGCAAPPGPQQVCGYPALDRAVLILERGRETSSLAKLEGGCLTEAPAEIVLGRDQNLLSAGGQALAGVNDSGAIFAVDPAGPSLVAPGLDAYADGAASKEPHGIYGADRDGAGQLWVARFDVPSLIILSESGGVVDTVDLRALDATYGNPRANGVYLRGDRAYVSVGFLPTPVSDEAARAGGIAVISTAAPREVTGVIDLVGKNPVHRLVPADASGSRVIVATPGRYDAEDASDGIDLAALDGSEPARQLVSEDELHGSADEVVWGGDHEVYAIVLGKEPGLNPTRVVAIDPTLPPGSRVVATLAEAPWFDDPVNGAAYVHTGLALTQDHLLVGDHTPGAGRIRIFSRSTFAEVASVPTEVGAPWALLAMPP